MTTYSQEARERLTRAIEDRRDFLRIKWQDIAQRAVFSIATLGRVRRGEGELTADTKSGLEDALEWERGSVDAILAGGEPIPRQPAQPSQSPASSAARGLLAEWTPDEIERVGAMTLDQIEAEGKVIGRFSGETARARYLHDAAIIKLRKSTQVSAKPGTLGR
jgi:hypothetical protein